MVNMDNEAVLLATGPRDASDAADRSGDRVARASVRRNRDLRIRVSMRDSAGLS